MATCLYFSVHKGFVLLQCCALTVVSSLVCWKIVQDSYKVLNMVVCYCFAIFSFSRKGNLEFEFVQSFVNRHVPMYTVSVCVWSVVSCQVAVINRLHSRTSDQSRVH